MSTESKYNPPDPTTCLTKTWQVGNCKKNPWGTQIEVHCAPTIVTTTASDILQEHSVCDSSGSWSQDSIAVRFKSFGSIEQKAH